MKGEIDKEDAEMVSRSTSAEIKIHKKGVAS